MPPCSGCRVSLEPRCQVYEPATGGALIEGEHRDKLTIHSEVFCVRCAYPDGPVRCWFCGTIENPAAVKPVLMSVDPLDRLSPPNLQRQMCLDCQRRHLADEWSDTGIFHTTLLGVLIPQPYKGDGATMQVRVGNENGIVLPYVYAEWQDQFPIEAWFSGGREFLQVGFHPRMRDGEMYAENVHPCRLCVAGRMCSL